MAILIRRTRVFFAGKINYTAYNRETTGGLMDGFDNLEEAFGEVARDAIKDTILTAAREVKWEMGTTAASVTFEYVEQPGHSIEGTQTVGNLQINGDEGVIEEFRNRVQAKFDQ